MCSCFFVYLITQQTNVLDESSYPIIQSCIHTFLSNNMNVQGMSCICFNIVCIQKVVIAILKVFGSQQNWILYSKPIFP